MFIRVRCRSNDSITFCLYGTEHYGRSGSRLPGRRSISFLSLQTGGLGATTSTSESVRTELSPLSTYRPGQMRPRRARRHARSPLAVCGWATPRRTSTLNVRMTLPKFDDHGQQYNTPVFVSPLIVTFPSSESHEDRGSNGPRRSADSICAGRGRAKLCLRP